MIEDMQSFTIPGRLDGLNAYVNACRQNPQAGAACKRNNQNRVIEAIKKANLKPMKTPVVVEVFWFERDMRRDKDNVRSGIKYILDGLVQAGIIEDDGWKHINTIVDRYFIDKDNPRVRVYLYDYDDMRAPAQP